MMQQRLSAIGEAEGIHFKYGGRTGRTRDSHRLIQLGKSKSPAMQTKVVEQLFRAYFEEEKDITDHEVLLEAGVNAGLQKEEVKKLLETDQCGELVDEEVEEAQMRRIQGVPHFVVENRYEVGGAQEANTFVEIFEEVAKRHSGGMPISQGMSC
jgi:predicted DsbA family dithiol-disulfide isomerase